MIGGAGETSVTKRLAGTIFIIRVISAALAATETGGSLSVHSAGLGHGATFELELPMDETTNGKPRTAALVH